MTTCRVCDRPITPFMSFGKMPRANGYLAPGTAGPEYFFELATCFCSNCKMFQLMEQPAAEKMFNENYAFHSSTSSHMQVHFEEFGRWAISTYLAGRTDPFVVEIGSNDGIMLQTFQRQGIRHLGVEPSKSVAAIAVEKDIRTAVSFFNADFARRTLDSDGGADLILAANVIAHIADIKSVAKGVAALLKRDGLFIFENAYLGAVLKNTAYDQIYDEHVFTFCALSVSEAFGRFGLELVDVLPQATHGGSMRFVFAHKGARDVAPAVAQLLQEEQRDGLDRIDTYLAFKSRCEQSRDRLRGVLNELRNSGATIAGYGATAKSATVINYCGLNADQIAWITDNTPAKQGKLSPGAHLPIVPHEHFLKNYPDYAVLFAWNHAAEICAKEAQFAVAGGKWIVFVPDVAVVTVDELLNSVRS